MKASTELQAFLERKTAEYNRPSFIADDPISVPHSYVKQQDIEIAGFFAAIFSWGNRKTIIRKSQELMQLMDKAPYQFVLQHSDNDLKKLLDFRHRTFNATDLLYFIAFFRHHYSRYSTLEEAFLLPWEQRADGMEKPAVGRKKDVDDREKSAVGRKKRMDDREQPAGGRDGAAAGPNGSWDAEGALSAFYSYFFSLADVPPRTRKHIATPERNSSCKRINMFLRWMVRKDDFGVDFGLWRRIPQARLICPLDLHVARVARKFGLLHRQLSDWKAALELTDRLRELDPLDPVRFDFALFGLGVMEKF